MVRYDETKLRRGFPLKGGRARFRVTVQDGWSLLVRLSLVLHVLWLGCAFLAFALAPPARLILLAVAVGLLVVSTLLTLASARRMTQYRIEIDLSKDSFQVLTKGRPCSLDAIHMKVVPRGLIGHCLVIWITSGKSALPLSLAASKDLGTMQVLMEDLRFALGRSEQSPAAAARTP